jgi:hypothetical protein
MAICNEPEIPKEIWTLLTKGIAGQRGKSKTLSMIIRFIRPVFPSFSISKGIVLQLMMRSKGMNQREHPADGPAAEKTDHVLLRFGGNGSRRLRDFDGI